MFLGDRGGDGLIIVVAIHVDVVLHRDPGEPARGLAAAEAAMLGPEHQQQCLPHTLIAVDRRARKPPAR